MFKATQESNDFFHRQGSKSLRAFTGGGGWNDLGAEPEIIKTTYREQYGALKKRKKEIDQEIAVLNVRINGGTTAESISGLRQQKRLLSNERASIIREKGNMARILERGCRLAFETIFVDVANKRLPRDAFLLIVEEAREIWRHEDWPASMPGQTNRQKKKNRSRALGKEII